MRITVKANLSGAVTANKGQTLTVTEAKGQELIQRGLAVAVETAKAAPKPAAAKKAQPKQPKPEHQDA